ncbi:LLM class flavin-dependent oxidoreductase, partial [Streptococcus anginosus]|nr:LLM class flavin-dependent oxidoreductase [Streptococcus anginosus]
YSLGDHLPHPISGKKLSAAERLEEMIQLAKLAEDAGFDAFQVGESHQDYFVSQSNFIILSAIARETNSIKIGSAVTTLSVLDPVRVYEDAATID